MVRKYYDKPQNSNNHNNKNNPSYQKKNNKSINSSSNTTPTNNKQNQNQTTKPVNQAVINNLSKFAAFGKMLNSTNNKKPQQHTIQPINTNASLNTQTISVVNLPNTPKQIGANLLQKTNKYPCPSAIQVGQTLKNLKILQQLLDSYEQLQMDQNCNLKKLIEYIQNNKATQKMQQQG